MRNEYWQHLYQILDEIKVLTTQLNNNEFIFQYNFLINRINNPESYIVMLGETSSGKTTLINGLLAKNELKTSATPTTGSIIEIMQDADITDYQYFVVNKNLSEEKIDKKLFDELNLKPNNILSRLQLKIPSFNYGLKNLHLFDTPGYNSLYEEHEEILKEFIPNSDIIIYTVSYETGIQEYDNQFLKFIYELLSENDEFYLLINKVPENLKNNNKRIEEILMHTQDCLHRQNAIKYFVIYTETLNNVSPQFILPKAENLWTEVSENLISERRQLKLLINLFLLVEDLLIDFKIHLEKIILNIKCNEEKLKESFKIVEEFLEKKQIVLNNINSTYKRMFSIIPDMFDNIEKELITIIIKEIDNFSKYSKMEECTAYIQSHLLEHNLNIKVKQIGDYIKSEQELLDKENSSIINTAQIELHKNLILKNDIFAPIIETIGQKAITKSMYNLSIKFFSKYGGRGGFKAGIPNLAKKVLSKTGRLFNKTFSKETHNKLAQMISKIGANSAKAVTAAALIITEGLCYMYESLTWQKKLRENTKNSLKDWKEKTMAQTLKDLKELEEDNYQIIENYFAEYKETFTFNSEENNNSISLNDAETFIIKINSEINKIDQIINKFITEKGEILNG